ncbi:hypothetical protein [Actinoallomurus rhizosphaericola]|uniref:hypothetical protein n=1 Tax=Actinoallomurus rhizosphaericola TaxID=2952536 RepID=UPI002091CBD8|nr:hypothetical protein [Actinoallomurus rhizosphaericola]MCO5994604.1 hypothetical protein [Actinoallomurus rhizosphaericola]
MQANFISGDPQGLYRLAGEMYGYVAGRSGDTVRLLARTVDHLVKDDGQPGGYTPGPDGKGWIGYTAFVFRQTFISDAAMMNGLNSVICSIAKTVDDLAVGLSYHELQLELALEKFAKGNPHAAGFSLNWLATSGKGTSPTFDFTNLAPPAVRNDSTGFYNFIGNCNVIGQVFFTRADKLRHTAASQLVAVGKVLEEALSYYANYSASPGSPTAMDPSVLITSSQAKSNSQAQKDLEGQYDKLVGQLNASSLNQDSAEKVLKDLNLGQEKATKIVGSIKSAKGDLDDLKGAKDVLGKGNALLSFVGNAMPLLMEIGLLG